MTTSLNVVMVLNKPGFLFAFIFYILPLPWAVKAFSRYYFFNNSTS